MGVVDPYLVNGEELRACYYTPAVATSTSDQSEHGAKKAGDLYTLVPSKISSFRFPSFARTSADQSEGKKAGAGL